MKKNNTIPSSTQQDYIHSILGGEKNYIFGSFALDILLDENTYVECDFSGHSMSVSLGNISKGEFEDKEKRRFYFMRNNGYKMIRIISEKNRIPIDKSKILDSIELSRELIKSGRSWVKIYFDRNKIECSGRIIDFDFGDTRIMTKKNVDKFKVWFKKRGYQNKNIPV